MDFEIFLLQTLVTAFCYLCIPGCVCVLCWAYDKKLSLKAIKRIVLIHGFLMWLILQVIRIERGMEGTSAAVFLWSSLAYWMLKKKCLKKE